MIEPGARSRPIFAGARLPNVSMTSTEVPTHLVPASGYTNMLAEPWYIMRHGEARWSGDAVRPSCNNQDASDAADPRLGTRIGLAPRGISSNVTSFV
jgi:hypothetical protein